MHFLISTAEKMLYVEIGFCFSEYRRMLEEAKLELKKSKRKDYYKILGIPKGCPEEEIKKGYKKEALKHHPG